LLSSDGPGVGACGRTVRLPADGVSGKLLQRLFIASLPSPSTRWQSPSRRSGENFLTLGYFLAVVTGRLEFHKRAINLTACEHGMINGLQIVIPSSRLPWLLDNQIDSFESIKLRKPC